MPNAKQIKEEALGKVNGAMTAIGMYDGQTGTNTSRSINLSVNPIDLIMDFLKTTKGYDWIVETVSKYIAFGIPPLEIATKGILLFNIQTILSCSIKPFITEEMIKNGVVFDLNQIDLLGIFKYSPINTKPGVGKFYYFGCSPEDGIVTIDDVKYSRDLNAVLWYAKEHPGERVVWKNENDIGIPVRGGEIVPGSNTFYKQPKENGIVTIEFSGRSSNLKNSVGNMYTVQEPSDSAMHVFVGFAGNYPDVSEQNAQNNIVNCNRMIAEYEEFFKKLDNYKSMCIEWQKKRNTIGIENGYGTDYFAQVKNDYDTDLSNIDKCRRVLMSNPQELSEWKDEHLNGFNLNGIYEVERGGVYLTIPNVLTNDTYGAVCDRKLESVGILEGNVHQKKYPTPDSNYYFRHLLMEFNTDFVMSMKLFDKKTLTAQLIDALTNCLNLNAGISIEEKIIKAQVKDMVKRIIENDDTVINDCFFSFTNDQYNALLTNTDLARMGVTQTALSASQITPEQLMNSLNMLDSSASEEEAHTIIKNAIFEAVSHERPVGFDEYEYNLNFNIIEELLTMLVYTIVLVVLSPKIYILLMTNLKLMGEIGDNFDIRKFIQQIKDLINSLIRGIRDQIIQFFYNEILSILQDLLSRLGVMISLEQYRYYVELLRHCLDCIRIHGQEYDWMQANIGYADIEEANKIVNEQC